MVLLVKFGDYKITNNEIAQISSHLKKYTSKRNEVDFDEIGEGISAISNFMYLASKSAIEDFDKQQSQIKNMQEHYEALNEKRRLLQGWLVLKKKDNERRDLEKRKRDLQQKLVFILQKIEILKKGEIIEYENESKFIFHVCKHLELYKEKKINSLKNEFKNQENSKIHILDRQLLVMAMKEVIIKEKQMQKMNSWKTVVNEKEKTYEDTLKEIQEDLEKYKNADGFQLIYSGRTQRDKVLNFLAILELAKRGYGLVDSYGELKAVSIHPP